MRYKYTDTIYFPHGAIAPSGAELHLYRGFTVTLRHSHSRYDSPSRVISPSQTTLPPQHITLTTEKDKCPGGIGTRNPSKRAAAYPRLRRRNHWDRHILVTYLHSYLLTFLLTYFFTYLLIFLLTYILTWFLTYLFSYLLSYLLTYFLTYLLTFLLTPWSRVLLDKLTAFQIVKKFPSFYGTRWFIPHSQLSQFWASLIPSISTKPTSWRSMLLLSSNLRLVSQEVSFPQVSSPKPCISFSSPSTATYPAHLIILDFITRTILGKSTDH